MYDLKKKITLISPAFLCLSVLPALILHLSNASIIRRIWFYGAFPEPFQFCLYIYIFRYTGPNIPEGRQWSYKLPLLKLDVWIKPSVLHSLYMYFYMHLQRRDWYVEWSSDVSSTLWYWALSTESRTWPCMEYVVSIGRLDLVKCTTCLCGSREGGQGVPTPPPWKITKIAVF